LRQFSSALEDLKQCLKLRPDDPVALAAMAKDREELINESADLLYHLTVLLQNEGLALKDVVQRLYERHQK
jgi:phosphoribosyl-ATP pyrophosphohydrolase